MSSWKLSGLQFTEGGALEAQHPFDHCRPAFGEPMLAAGLLLPAFEVLHRLFQVAQVFLLVLQKLLCQLAANLSHEVNGMKFFFSFLIRLHTLLL
jgi:hypothetical protein